MRPLCRIAWRAPFAVQNPLIRAFVPRVLLVATITARGNIFTTFALSLVLAQPMLVVTKSYAAVKTNFLFAATKQRFVLQGFDLLPPSFSMFELCVAAALLVGTDQGLLMLM